MNDMLSSMLSYLDLYLLILARCIGLFLVSPVFGRNNLPNIFKLGFCAIMAYILLPYVKFESISNLVFLNVIIILIKELIIGFTIGFIAFVVFSTFFLAGHFIDVDLGFSMANILDPQYGTQVSLTGNFIYILATLVFLILNGHHYLIKSLINSFYVIPINSPLIIRDDLLRFLISIINFVFFSAIKIAIPIMICIALVNIILGILARTMPQMNVFVIGMPLKIVIGLAIFSFILPHYLPVFKEIFNQIYKYIFEGLKVLKG